MTKRKKNKRGLVDLILWLSGYYNDPEPLSPVPTSFSFPNPKNLIDSNRPTVCWINHSTFLIEWEGLCFLTDPIWSRRCSPFSFLGPVRQFEPPFPLKSLPKIDFVIISHDHYDHLDVKTVKNLLNLFPELEFIVSFGLKKWFNKHFPKAQVIELKWGQSHLSKNVEFQAVPAFHFSGRSPFNRNKTEQMGCVVKQGIKSFYFVGDTGYNEIFKELGPFDLSLIPIGHYSPRSFMRPVHICPFEAVKIHQDVKSQLSIAGHFGTFHLSSEKMDQPPFDLFNALVKENISWEKFRVLHPGQKLNW